MHEPLTTVDAVITALGGTRAVADLTASKSMQRVSNWKKRGRFPATTYLSLQAGLLRIGKSAPASLWRLDDPASEVGQEATA